jgi:hypothetical protein
MKTKGFRLGMLWAALALPVLLVAAGCFFDVPEEDHDHDGYFDDDQDWDDDWGDDDGDDDADGRCDQSLCADGYAILPTCADTSVRGGLEWTVCDNGDDISHYCAACYAETLTVGGKSDWRLPTLDELRSLYAPGNTRVTECGSTADIADPFVLSCFYAWTGVLEGSAAAYGVDFSLGTVQVRDRSSRESARVLAVRSR